MHANLTDSSCAALVVVACVAVEAAKGTPIKNKLTPMVDLPTSGQDAAEKAISSKLFAFSHFLGGCKLMPKCIVPLRYIKIQKHFHKLPLICWLCEAFG